MQRLALLVTFLAFAGAARAQDDGYKPMFNGKDFTGWVNVNGAPSTWFIKDDMVITTGKPMGFLRTERHYENFIAEFDWLHAPESKGSVGNSGFFVWCDPLPSPGIVYTRGVEVQVLVNLLYKDKKTGLPTATSHGDIFSIHGATCKPDRPHPAKAQRCLPSENRCKGEFEWNHYKVIGNNGVLKLEVNGKEVSGVTECSPRKGYLAFEAEGSECRFKNLKLKELPSTKPQPSEIAELDKGFRSIFTGLDLTGWKATDEHKTHWTVKGDVLNYDAKKKGELPLWSAKAYGDFELVCDWKATGSGEIAVYVRGTKKEIAFKDKKLGVWHRSVLHLKGNRATLHIDKELVAENVDLGKLPATGPIALVGNDPLQFRNVYIRELK